MNNPTSKFILLSIVSTVAWAAPNRLGIEQQLASIKTQRESMQKQLASAHITRWRSVAVSPPARIAATIRISPPAPLEASSAVLPPAPLAELAPLLPPAPSALPFDCAPLTDAEADPLIESAAGREMLSPALLRSVIRHESGFRPCAVSPMGAQGLMQLMPATAYELGVTDPFDPRQNIAGGAAFLRQLLNRYSGSMKLALSAYNAGIGRVETAGGVPDLLETQNYVSGILGDLGVPYNDPPTSSEELASPPETPRKEDFRHITLQLSLLPQTTTKSSVQLTTRN